MKNASAALGDEILNADPFTQFDIWYRYRLSLNLSVPNSMSLGTLSGKSGVSVRTVLLKSYDNEGFVFFTNYLSRKGNQLETNKNAALLFYWPESEQQIRVEGSVTKIKEEWSDKYFMSRPLESRIAAWASEQSSIIADRKYLEGQFDHYKTIFKNKTVERPPHWGGYLLIPYWFEFWTEGKHRLHNRISYSLTKEGWKMNRLAP
jgi:pyridoxamine 5'-phosphate oxidase